MSKEVNSYPRLTGRMRHRSVRRFGHEHLILQVEIEGWHYGDSTRDVCLAKWWRDARTSDVTVVGERHE